MNGKPSPDDMSASAAARPASGFTRLFVTGVAGWLAGMLAVFAASWGLTKPEGVSSAFMGALDRAWMAFLAGGLLMIAHAALKRLPIGRAAMAYALPVALLAGAAGICLAIYPDSAFRGDLSVHLPVVLVFYVFGACWLLLRERAAGEASFSRAVLPSLAGGLMILAFVAVPVFGSDAFRYRDAFGFSVSKPAMKDGKLLVEGRLEIRKPGNYQFSAPRYHWEAAATDGDDIQLELGEITWGGSGAPASGATGVFPLRISWSKAVPGARTAGWESDDDMFSLDVRSTDDGNRVVGSLNATVAR